MKNLVVTAKVIGAARKVVLEAYRGRGGLEAAINSLAARLEEFDAISGSDTTDA